MPFRIGFEFQLNGKLCAWAKDNYDLQKKPIFSVYYEKKGANGAPAEKKNFGTSN
jgi:hypothetical protein